MIHLSGCKCIEINKELNSWYNSGLSSTPFPDFLNSKKQEISSCPTQQ